jgi:hypothetical protein
MSKKDLKRSIVQFEKKLPYKMYDYDFERGFYRVDETITVDWELFFSTLFKPIRWGVNGSCSYLWKNKYEITLTLASVLLLEKVYKNKKYILQLLNEIYQLEQKLSSCEFRLGPMELIQQDLEIGILDILAKLHLTHEKKITALKIEFDQALKICQKQDKNKLVPTALHLFNDSQGQQIQRLEKLLKRQERILKKIQPPR